MKKTTLIVIIAVALLGIVGLIQNGSGSSKTNKDSSAIANQANNPSPTVSNASSPSSTESDSSSSQSYKNGTYSASSETPYGAVGINVVVAGGRISEINFTALPNDHPESIRISNYSAPILRDNALKAQSAKIDFVSGATSTSYGFAESLQSALDQATKS